MKIHNFNLRGLSHELMMALKKEAKQQNTSVNMLILKLIEQGTGVANQMKVVTYHDLDHLAGTWTNDDEKEFVKNTQSFEKLDKDIW
jgi:hypothetical protein